MINRINITENISYIPASEEPLSADVILVEGTEYLYVFDVGNNEQVAEYLNSIPKKKRVILSHFHTDHMGNIGRVQWETVFFGANTEKYFQHYINSYAAERFAELPQALEMAVRDAADTENGTDIGEDEGTNRMVKAKFPRYKTMFEPVLIEDGVSIGIYPVPNSHAKGSLLLQVNDQYLFLGDSLYSKVEDGCYIYNQQLLKEEIELLNDLAGDTVFSSHEKQPLKAKKAVIRYLEAVYEKRQKGEPYIKVEIM